MAKELKVTMLPAPGGYAGQGQTGSYEQSDYKVDDTFEFDVLDGEQWFQFNDVEGTEYAFPMGRIVALAVRQL